MTQVTVVARIKAKPEASTKVREELLKLIEPTRKESGCISYDLHQDNEDATLFFFLENWESKELLDKHLKSEHIKAYLKSTENLVEQWDLNLLTKID
ncbi:MAG: putative quinol monooxygenase [Candidatus Saccharibacteria bacterium]